MPKRPPRCPYGPCPEDREPAVFFETLDLLPQHHALMTPAGEVVRLNRWLVELLRRMPRGRYLEEALGSFARTIADAGRSRTGARPVDTVPMRELRTALATFRMWGWWVELDRYGLGHLLLMTVQPVDLEAVSDVVLRKRFGLTPKEIAVARLLAEGRSNESIAVALCISRHTARHHTEAVMAKLGVSSRAEVGPRLRDLPPEQSN